MGDASYYLGIPFSLTPKKTHLFHPCLKKLFKKLNSWHDQYLSKVGMTVMIKFVLHSIPVQIMSCIKLPKQTCTTFDQKVRKFFWNGSSHDNKLHLINWDKHYYSKKKSE